MIFIAHRGNQNGPNPERENHPDYITQAIDHGFHVEIDLWWLHNELVLGHDEPQYEIGETFLKGHSDVLWCHAKDANVLRELLCRNLHCFFHQVDDVVLTSRQYLWTFPGKPLVPGAVAVLPERNNVDITGCSAVCTDFPRKHRNSWAENRKD